MSRFERAHRRRTGTSAQRISEEDLTEGLRYMIPDYPGVGAMARKLGLSREDTRRTVCLLASQRTFDGNARSLRGWLYAQEREALLAAGYPEDEIPEPFYPGLSVIAAKSGMSIVDVAQSTYSLEARGFMVRDRVGGRPDEMDLQPLWDRVAELKMRDEIADEASAFLAAETSG